MKEQIERVIEELRQNKQRFDASADLHIKLWNGENPGKQPLLLYCSLDDKNGDLPVYNTKEIHYDSEKMLMFGLREAIKAADGGAEAVPSVRANMGCGIFPTLFGVRQELFDDKMPWVQQHLSKETIMKMTPEDLVIGDEFKAGLEHMAYIAEKLSDTGCMVFPMDVQGAFDTAHIVYGDAIFYDLYDDPKFIHHLLNLSCEAIFLGMKECLSVMPDSGMKIAHYNGLVMPRSKGGIKLSEDTSTLLSREHIEEFVLPYMNKVLAYFGGGYIHYCGRNPNLFEALMDSDWVYGINFGNPEKHNMETILQRCACEGKVYYGAIPREDQNLEEYFYRLLRASSVGERSLLLLQYSCKEKERDDVLKAWNAACSRAY